jgi:DAK2 domain fusion protein YloV
MTGIERVDGPRFVALIRAGHARLKAMAEAVNALNVFPVPDGDTGTNMEMSLAAGVAKLNEYAGQDLAGAAQALASGLLMGARGNSGVILSQLFRGFLKVAREADDLDTRRFAAALQEGVQIAYRAVAKPVEGTMLTVAREAAAAGVREARKTRDFARWMRTVVDAARQSLQRTPDLLPVLRQAGVVDSGGQGLVYIYEGFLAHLEGQTEIAAAPAEIGARGDIPLDYAAAHIDHEGEYGYCTEVLIDAAGRDNDEVQAALRQQLASYGDSLLVVGAEPLVKVHVHTLHPGRVLEDALQYGELVKVKVDNMTRQHEEIRAGRAAAPEVRQPVSGSPIERVRCGTVAVAAGEGLAEILRSLGVQRIVSGGQTMNPSTEEIVEAVRSVAADEVLILPNNRNIILAAEQAARVAGSHVCVVPTASIPQCIAALMAYRPEDAAAVNMPRMAEAMAAVRWGQVVQAARDSVYQGRNIQSGEYLGFAGPKLVETGTDRLDVLVRTVAAVADEDAELLTLLYGDGVSPDELNEARQRVESQLGLEVEVRFGGQPVYDYIFSVE